MVAAELVIDIFLFAASRKESLDIFFKEEKYFKQKLKDPEVQGMNDLGGCGEAVNF